DDDLVALYNLTSLFVFPSLQEGFGLPALEAMSCGVPVIGSNNSSIPEVIGRSDALFDPNRIEQISGKMQQVLEQSAFAASLAAHGLEQAKQFSWDASAQKTLG
ncbi:MAG: glycosyltransferase, partial [Rhodospirillaceae bacterium]|nr:glycosyltransferase [Rhodospirillaceae bacterium]